MQRSYSNIKELSEYLGIKINTIYSWVHQRKIPYIKLGGLIRFDKGRIDEWLKEKAIETYPIR